MPYDDAMVGGFAGDASGDDLPPFDVPGATPAPKSAVAAPKEEDAPAAPWESNPGAGSPFGHQGAAPSIPQTEDEAKDLIRSVFGQATIFKPVEYTAQEENPLPGRICIWDMCSVVPRMSHLSRQVRDGRPRMLRSIRYVAWLSVYSTCSALMVAPIAK